MELDRPRVREDYISPRPRIRVIHTQEQILFPEDIEIGQKLLLFRHFPNNEPSMAEEWIIKRPRKKEPGWVFAEFTFDTRGLCFYEKRSLADAGVISYPDGTWNPYNWLEKVS